MEPTLETERLLLRPFAPGDAPVVVRLAGARAIADTTISIPHPYEIPQADAWIAQLPEEFRRGAGVHCAIALKASGELIGAIGLRGIDTEHSQAELGFWIGAPWWNQGYASEAARRLIGYAFAEMGLNRIYAHHMVRNPASGRVLRKAGMREEGLLRQRVRKWGVFEDVVLVAALREEWPR